MANEFVSFNPYDEQLEALRRRQRMADMLREQSMEPFESQVAPGGYVVPTPPILGLAKMLQAYRAGRSQRAIDKEMSELRSRAAYDTRQQQAEQTAAMKGIVGRLTGQRDEVGPMEQAVLGAPMPPKPITVTPQMDRAGQILSGKDEELAEFEPTAQYRYDPKDAQQMVMTSPAFDPSTRGQMLAAALKQTMEKPEAEEFGTTPVLGADGKYYLVSKRGKMVATGVAGPTKESPALTPYQQQTLDLRRREFEAKTSKAGDSSKTSGDGAKAPTEGERKDAYNASRIGQAIQQINDALAVESSAAKPSFSEKVAGSVPVWGEVLKLKAQSPSRQIIESAFADLIDASLTLATGAAYTKEQLDAQRMTLMPQMGESEKSMKVKRERLRNLINNAKIRAGKAWTPELEKLASTLFAEPSNFGLPPGFVLEQK